MIDRVPFAVVPTPLQPMDRLGATLGFAPGCLWVKRDDLTALAGGGNKARKLEYLVADAVAHGARTLVTAGAAQSNHVRATAAAARQVGMGCVAVLGGDAPELDEGNVVLDRLLGVEIVWAGEYEAYALERDLAETMMRLDHDGRAPYEIPLGGASAIGTLGYVRAADEIMAEAPQGSIVYTATGTGGTQAGLVVGIGHHERVRGVDVGAVPDVDRRILELVPAAASLSGREMPNGALQLDRERVGKAYGSFTRDAREAIRLTADAEGLVLDPVYSGKAMAGLIHDRRSGRLAPDQPVVFVHTGGLPSLFTARTAAWLAAT